MADIIQIRRDTEANWASENPILAQGEFGYETDTVKLKVGDGTTAYNSLSYLLNPDLSGHVPYSGATTNLNLGSYSISASNLSGTNTGDQDLSGYSLTSHNHDSTYEPLKGADDNYVTDAEKTVIGNTSGVNTGDQDLSGYSLTSHLHSGTYEPANSNIQTHISSAHAPSDAEQNVQSDWDAVSGDAQILNKPTIPSSSTFIPYSGATSDVDLGTNTILAGNIGVSNFGHGSSAEGIGSTSCGNDAGFGSGTVMMCSYFGDMTGMNASNSFQTGLGALACNNDEGYGTTVVGGAAAQGNIGDYCTGIGVGVLKNNEGNNCIGIGNNVLEDNTDDNLFEIHDHEIHSTPFLHGNMYSGNLALENFFFSNGLYLGDYEDFTVGMLRDASDRLTFTDSDETAVLLTDLVNANMSIEDLNDVASMTPTDGQVLTYDTTNGWQAETSSGGGVSTGKAIAMAMIFG